MWPRNDFYRSREASRAVEARYGLRPTSPADRTGTPPVTRAEQRKHDQTAARRRAAGLPGPSAPDRQVLRQQVRACAAGASSLEDFLARLRSEGLLVRERFSEHTPGQITGYAVALPDRYDSGASPIFFGGGKLAPDLTGPKLQQRWAEQAGAGAHAGSTGSWSGPAAASAATGAAAGAADRGGADRFGLTVEERQWIYAQAARAASEATRHILDAARLDPNGAADAAWAASDFLAAAARVVEGRRGGPLTGAAREYDRAARELFGRTTPRTAAGNGLRVGGRLCSARGSRSRVRLSNFVSFWARSRLWSTPLHDCDRPSSGPRKPRPRAPPPNSSWPSRGATPRHRHRHRHRARPCGRQHASPARPSRGDRR